MKVLVVEDDVRLANAVEQILREGGYDASSEHDGESGLQTALKEPFDVIILDVMLPKRNGFSVVKELRRLGCNTPILLLTARDSVPDKIAGFDCGADDYMTKPFSPAELLAHLRALLRRQGEVIFETMRFADLSLDLESFELTCTHLSGGSDSIRLSNKEYALLRVLMANPGQTVSKDVLIERVWGSESRAEDNNVEAYVSFVRKKISFLGSRVQIETLRKAGYRLVEGSKTC